MFASSFHTGSTPFKFKLGSSEVVEGWTLTLTLTLTLALTLTLTLTLTVTRSRCDITSLGLARA